MTLPVLDDIVISPLFYFISVWETPPRWCTNKITTTKCLRCNCTVWDWCSTSVRPVIGGSMSHNFTLITRWIFTCLSGWYCRKKLFAQRYEFIRPNSSMRRMAPSNRSRTEISHQLIIPSWSKETSCDGVDVEQDVGIDMDFVLGTIRKLYWENSVSPKTGLHRGKCCSGHMLFMRWHMHQRRTPTSYCAPK